MLSIDYLDAIRVMELETILPFLRSEARVLEIGAGSGRQALELSKRGFDVAAIDVASSDYARHRVYPVAEYDGTTFPFDDNSFDLIYSSNLLEHVSDLSQLHREIKRVMRPLAECVHVVPTHTWRFWTSAVLLPAVLRKIFSGCREGLVLGARRSASAALRRHGERGNVITELWLFHPRWWRRNFAENGFEILEERPVGLFYTAEGLFGLRLSINGRRALSRTIGSSTRLFRIRPALIER